MAVRIIEQSIEQVFDQMKNPRLDAAITYARKRKLGVFRNNPKIQQERRQKDIASMMRAGHPYDLVKKIFECSSIDEVEGLID